MKNKKIQKVLAYLSVFAFSFIPLHNVCYAEEVSAEVSAGVSAGQEVQTEVSYPYNKLFKITAYYSPLEAQEKYVTGSYAGDIRLNGSGIRSADGTPVYPGMIAAPKSYPFGIKMRIPGIGTVAVHDRGGAIVHAGERSQEHDRLDVWMGYGDVGLIRALNWGARVTEVTILGVDPAIQDSVYLEGFSEAEKFVRSVIARPQMFQSDIWFGAQGLDVEKLQEVLTDLGYFDEPVSGYFGPSTQEAILSFQMDYGVVTSVEDFGAGHFGPQTRLKIEAVYEKKKTTNLKNKNIGMGSSGDDVKFLQEALKKLGYAVNVTGEYDQQTVDAVFKFQFDHRIINSEYDLGAGFFGPKSFQVMVLRLVTSNYKEEEKSDSVLLENDLQFGDQGPSVQRLQEELKALNFLRIDPTGYFGQLTGHAVLKFQQANNLVEDETSVGAGVFGPLTRAKMNEVLAQKGYAKRLIAEKRTTLIAQAPLDEQKAEEKEPLFAADLDPGISSPLVKKLQTVLKDFGYYNGMVTTEYFGEKTRDAVIAFQIDKGIISSPSDIGAGRIGPQTRDLLNSLI